MAKRGKSDYQGPIYFDNKGRDVYSSKNTHLENDEGLKQLSNDLSEGTTTSSKFEPFENQEMSRFFGMQDVLNIGEAADR